jgi:cytidine deaminase
MKIENKQLSGLINEARAVVLNSYSPYSGIRISAAILSGDGRVACGVNVENASYGLSICAERVAVFRAVAEGMRDFKAICIYSEDVEPVPCGACLQVLSEFFTEDKPVIVCHKDSIKIYKLSELYPNKFNLEKR